MVVLQVHDVMNAGELGLGAELPTLEAAAGGVDELAGALNAVGIASVEDCAAIIGAASGAERCCSPPWRRSTARGCHRAP